MVNSNKTVNSEQYLVNSTSNNIGIVHDLLGVMPLDYSLFTNDYSLSRGHIG